MKSEDPTRVVCPHLREAGRAGSPRRLVGFVALLALLSCADPLSSPTGPAAGAVVELSASLTAIRREVTGVVRYWITVRAVDGTRRPVADAELYYSTLVASDSVDGMKVSGADGSATLLWVTRDTLVPLHLLEIRSGEAVLRIAGETDSTAAVATDSTSHIPVDTVRSFAPGGIAVKVLDALGRPVSQQVVVLRVTSGEGTLDHPTLVTDRSGTASTRWAFGPKAGSQTVQVSLPNPSDYRLVDLRSGSSVPPGQVLNLSGVALPGAPQVLNLASDTLQADAIGAQIRVAALSHDAYGNLIAQPRLAFETPDTNVARKQPDGSLRTAGTGVARVYVTAGVAKDSLQLLVDQKAVAISLSATVGKLNYIGARTAVLAAVVDRLGAPVAGAIPDLRNLTPSLAALAGPDTVVALRAGVALIESSIAGLADTLAVPIVQVPATIVLPVASDTMTLDRSKALEAQVFDSGGTSIPNPMLKISSDDESVVGAEVANTVRARLPGAARVLVRSGTASASYEVTVEGVALLVDGRRTSSTSVVSSARSLELTNGRIRLRWHSDISERGGFQMDTRTGRIWQPANMRGAGDWLYVTSTVVTEPTSISIVQDTPNQIGLAMRFGGHRFDPVLGLFPSWYENEPFPFTRTVWLSPREYGYFTWTQLERTMVWEGTELEVGFGGVFGPATIRTGHMEFTTQSLTRHMGINEPLTVPDAAELDLDGDPLMRVLVPLPEAPMISPVFPGWGYGSVYIHRRDYQSYGAYIYAAPRSVPTSGRQLCAKAWSTAPFPLRSLSAEELASCGAS